MKPKILLVEDEPIVQKYMMIMLKKLGCEVDVAAKGKDACVLAMHVEYDLILLDIGLPDMDGFDVARLIRCREKERGLYTPIVVTSTYGKEDIQQQCVSSGVDEIQQKLTTLEAIQKVLDRWLK